MRTAVIILSAFLLSFIVQDDDTGKLYVMALKKHIIVSQHSGKHNKYTFKDTIYVMNGDIVELPEQIEGHPVIALGDSAISFVKEKSSLHAIQINPIRVNKGNIIIALNDYVVSEGSEGANFSFGGGKEYTFTFNSATKQYTITRIKVISF